MGEWDYSLYKRDILARLGGAPLLCVSCGLRPISDLRQSHQSGSRIIQHQYPVPPLRIIHFYLSMCKNKWKQTIRNLQQIHPTQQQTHACIYIYMLFYIIYYLLSIIYIYCILFNLYI